MCDHSNRELVARLGPGGPKGFLCLPQVLREEEKLAKAWQGFKWEKTRSKWSQSLGIT